MALHKDVARFWVEYNALGMGKAQRGSGKSYARDSYDAVIRMSYDGENFYSYNTVVARFVVNGDGSKAVMISKETHSVATGTHLRYVRAAAELHHLRVFAVPALGRPGGWNHEPTRDVGREVSMYVHEDNIKDVYDDVLLAVAGGIKDYLSEDNPEWGHAARIRRLCQKAKGYASFFGIILEQDFDAETHIARMREERQDRLAKYLRPENIKRRDMARARNLLRKAMLND